jgi:hypothetical protein
MTNQGNRRFPSNPSLFFFADTIRKSFFFVDKL